MATSKKVAKKNSAAKKGRAKKAAKRAVKKAAKKKAAKKAAPKKAAAKKAATKRVAGVAAGLTQQTTKTTPKKGAMWSKDLANLFIARATAKYRAYCTDENIYVGDWTDFNQEQQDETTHKQQPGCQNHVTTYMIKQGA